MMLRNAMFCKDFVLRYTKVSVRRRSDERTRVGMRGHLLFHGFPSHIGLARLREGR